MPSLSLERHSDFCTFSFISFTPGSLQSIYRSVCFPAQHEGVSFWCVAPRLVRLTFPTFFHLARFQCKVGRHRGNSIRLSVAVTIGKGESSASNTLSHFFIVLNINFKFYAYSLGSDVISGCTQPPPPSVSGHSYKNIWNKYFSIATRLFRGYWEMLRLKEVLWLFGVKALEKMYWALGAGVGKPMFACLIKAFMHDQMNACKSVVHGTCKILKRVLGVSFMIYWSPDGSELAQNRVIGVKWLWYTNKFANIGLCWRVPPFSQDLLLA